MKKKILMILCGVMMLMAVPVMMGGAAYAEGVQTNLIECNGSGTDCICHIINLVIQVLVVIIGVVGAIGIVITGIQYMTAGGNEEKVRKSKRRMLELVIGLALYVVSASLIAWLTPGGGVCGSGGGEDGASCGSSIVAEF